jgi:hypothetical protein
MYVRIIAMETMQGNEKIRIFVTADYQLHVPHTSHDDLAT